ncbi:MAG: sulfatase-like hydrolase/transferase [Polyangiaceae bacterium]
MQRWAPFGSGAARFLYAAEDPAPRFPELLRDAGVTTVSFPSLQFLAQSFGVVRGFQEETMIAVGRRHAPGREVVDPLLARLEKVGAEPFFAFVHLTEPHSPYDRGGTEGSPRDRYLAEIGVADAQVARVSRLLEQRFRGRGYLLVTSDHGEAFGEHGTTHHTKTLYDELLRVPLLVRGPGVRARRIERPVGLIDLGPTVLDIFRRPIPASYLGQSLLPLLAGDDGAELTRPLLAEGRLRRALITGDRKVIEDLRRTTVEAYDLARDPGELVDLFDRERARFEPDLAMLRAFFGAHGVAARDPGYSAPYKP